MDSKNAAVGILFPRALKCQDRYPEDGVMLLLIYEGYLSRQRIPVIFLTGFLIPPFLSSRPSEVSVVATACL